MCRLFGFRSVLQSQVHQSLIHAENALATQSQRHPDGWGVGFFVLNAPHLIRSCETAVDDSLFEKVSGIVRSHTVLAHLRKATQGTTHILNTHPFQYGRWMFAHNGSIWNFAEKREALMRHIHEQLRIFILGETDSECFFYLILSQLMNKGQLEDKFSFNDVAEACRTSIDIIADEVSDYFPEKQEADREETSLSFILTDGQMMLAHNGGQGLFYSTHKERCSERDTCPYFKSYCESPVEGGAVNHLIFASEQLSGENIWTPLKAREIVGVDSSMHLHKKFG